MVDDWIPMAEAVRLTGYHHVTIRKLLLAKIVEGRKWGTIWQVSKASLLKYAAGMQKLGRKRGPKPKA